MQIVLSRKMQLSKPASFCKEGNHEKSIHRAAALLRSVHFRRLREPAALYAGSRVRERTAGIEYIRHNNDRDATRYAATAGSKPRPANPNTGSANTNAGPANTNAALSDSHAHADSHALPDARALLSAWRRTFRLLC